MLKFASAVGKCVKSCVKTWHVRSAQKGDYNIPHLTTSFGRHSFTLTGPSTWKQSLARTATYSRNLELSNKQRLRTELFQLSYMLTFRDWFSSLNLKFPSFIVTISDCVAYVLILFCAILPLNAAVQWRIQKFWKGGQKTIYQPPSSFITNVRNNL